MANDFIIVNGILIPNYQKQTATRTVGAQASTVPYYGANIENPTAGKTSLMAVPPAKTKTTPKPVADDKNSIIDFGWQLPKTGSGSGSGSGSSTTGGMTADEITKAKGEYGDAVNRYNTAYKNALSKYQFDFDQANADVVGSAQSEYVKMMQQRRVLGNQLAQSGLAQNTGYRGQRQAGIAGDYRQARGSVLAKYQRQVDNINMGIKTTTNDANENLTALYDRYKRDVNVSLKKNTAPTYGYKYTR